MIRILIVDDHTIVREGLKQILSDIHDMEVAGEASGGVDGLRRMRKEEWDLVLLDITMPDKDGFEVLKRIKKEKPKLPVIILTMHGEHLLGARCLKAGASGFLTKESASEQLVQAIRMALQGKKYVTPSIAEKILGELGPISDTDQPPHERLSDREFTILCKIASGRTVTEIADELVLSSRTVSTYRRRILDKMQMKHNAELTHYALKNGLVF
ncbi:MAG: response regulator transcription factor [Magnetococcales bacterium]|nr:response regulator transcription factor [Magnetococcales bacterium]